MGDGKTDERERGNREGGRRDREGEREGWIEEEERGQREEREREKGRERDKRARLRSFLAKLECIRSSSLEI